MTTPLPPGVSLMSALKDLNDSLRVDIMDALDKNAVEDLAEAALNVILGHIPASNEQLGKLRRYKSELLELTAGNTSEKRRLAILKGRGLFRSVASATDNVRRAQV